MTKYLFTVLLCLGALCPMTLANNLSINSVYVNSGNGSGQYKISIDAIIEMSRNQINILETGIPLTYRYSLIVEEKNALVWLEGKNDLNTYDFTITYNNLTQQYVVKHQSHKKIYYENFPTLSLALSYISEPKNLRVKIVDRKLDTEYRGGVRLKLDINALPIPLRIPAYASKDWNLDTGWKYWEFE